MVALQIRDVPEDVRAALAERAQRTGQSLQSFLLGLVTEEARRSGNAAVLGRFAHRVDGSRVDLAYAAAELRDQREDRVTRLGDSSRP